MIGCFLIAIATAAGISPVAVRRPLPDRVDGAALEAALVLRGVEVRSEGAQNDAELVAEIVLTTREIDGIETLVVRVVRPGGSPSAERILVAPQLADGELVRTCALLALEALRDLPASVDPPPAISTPRPTGRWRPGVEVSTGWAPGVGEGARSFAIDADGRLAQGRARVAIGFVADHRAPGALGGDTDMAPRVALPGSALSLRVLAGGTLERRGWIAAAGVEASGGVGEPVVVDDSGSARGRVRAREGLVGAVGPWLEVRSTPVLGVRAGVRAGYRQPLFPAAFAGREVDVAGTWFVAMSAVFEGQR